MPTVPDGIPEHTVAPNGERKAENQGPDAAHRERVRIALIIPVAQYASFSKFVTKHVRVIMPEWWGDGAELYVLPDLGEEFVDFDQYGKPPTITIPKSLPE
jgi:hypothetical protein